MNKEVLRFDTRWFKDSNDEEREKLKAQLLGDKKTLDKLRKILYNIVITEQNVNSSDYESPSWAYKQAHRNGRIDAFNTVIALIALDPTESPDSN